jgi:biotin synthase
MLECDCHIAALDRDAIVGLLTTALAGDLYRRADRVRHDAVGDEVHLRGLIEFSNICRNDCLYCGIRRSNRHVQRYRMDDDELVETARRAAALGFQTIVLQSGEDLHFDQTRMCRIIEQIKRLDVALTLSVGERDYADYKAFREAGADRYLLRIESTDRDLYHRLNPGMSWERRHECLLMIRELGYEVGSGIMVGQPDQTIASVANDLLYLKDLGIDMAGIGPFIPHPDTPLAGEQGGTLELALRTMAVMRLLMPDINIPATTAMESLHPQGRIMALQAGANVVMPNVTEGEYRRLYELYPGKICVNDTPTHCRSCIGLKIQSIGRTIGQGWGGHKTQRIQSTN